jgi:hypothetical protein
MIMAGFSVLGGERVTLQFSGKYRQAVVLRLSDIQIMRMYATVSVQKLSPYDVQRMRQYPDTEEKCGPLFKALGKERRKLRLTFALLFAPIAATGWNRTKRQVVIGDGARLDLEYRE